MRSARIRLLAVVLASCPLLSACDGGTNPVPVEVVGSYTLQTVDGNALPAPMGPATALSLTATGGTLALRPDGEYRQLIRTRFIGNAGTEENGANAIQGSFSITGTEIALRETLGEDRVGSIESGTVRYSISVGGRRVALVWRK